MKMEPCFSRRTVILIWLGFTLFFFTVQMIIVYVALNADADKAIGVVVSNKPKSTARFLHERLIRTIRDKVLTIPSDEGEKCHVPDDPLFPLCHWKIKEFNKTWDQKCHGEKYKVDPSSLCSVIQYLSEVQAWCPVLPWRLDENPYSVEREWQKATIQTNLSALLEKFERPKYSWMRKRIQEIFPHWIRAVEELGSRVNLHGRRRKKILVYMAAIEMNKYLDRAFKGGPLGELVQWSDLISALYILGHKLEIGLMKEEVQSLLVAPALDGCARQKLQNESDLIFTDILGVNAIAGHTGPDYSRYKCKLRVLDSFGTDAEFNYKRYKWEIPGGRSGWGDLDLHLAQFMTMFPHSPDNSFLGFAVPSKAQENNISRNKPNNRALVYGKVPAFWKGRANYIDTVKKYLNEVHATLGGTKETQRQHDVPKYVINHGIINITSLMNLLQSSKVFVGLGEPFEGPAALEALANGCFFINPKYIPPLDRIAGFFGGKPMDRKITSQNPYAEVFVGKPFVQTVDIKNLTEVEEALRDIRNAKGVPHLPYEFTHVGMLERVNAYVEKQDFCKPTNWPPLSELQIFVGGKGQSCIAICLRKQLICEPKFFLSLNVAEVLESSGFDCKSTFHRESILAPSINTTDSSCVLQTQPLLFSCRAARPGVVRVCPCRSYRKEQVALCETC